MNTPKKRNEAPRKRRLSTGYDIPRLKWSGSPIGINYSPANYSPLDNDLPDMVDIIGCNDRFLSEMLVNSIENLGR